MSISVTFTSPLTFGPIGPGQDMIQITQSSAFTAAIPDLTASIVGDANGVFSIQSMTSNEVETVSSTPDPGETKAPPKPVFTQTIVQIGSSNGTTPLPIAIKQFLYVTVQFAPTKTSPNTCTATLQVQGTGLNTASIPLTATIGQVTAAVPNVTLEQGKKSTVNVTVIAVAGPPTSATLTLETDTTPPPSGLLSLKSPTTVTVSPGKPATVALDVSTGDLNPGSYTFTIGGTAFGGAYTFSCNITLSVTVDYFAIKNVQGVIDESATATNNQFGLTAAAQNNTGTQQWSFMPDPAGSGYYYIVNKSSGKVIDIENASTAAGALLDAYPIKKAVDGFSGSDNQLWYFVSDPQNPSACRIVSKLNGNAIDVQQDNPKLGNALDAFPVKISDATNQQWTVVDGKFPSIVDSVPFPLFWGNGNVNYLLDGQGEALTGVSVTIKLSSDLISSSNGYGFQLNCYSTIGSSVTTVWQQFGVIATPGSSTLTAIVDTWSGEAPSFNQVNNIQVPFATLPSPTLPKDYSVTIALTYYQDPQYQYTDQYTAIVNGATYTVKDNSGKVVGTTTIGILGQQLYNSSQNATMANLAPIASLQLNIVADYNSQTATFTEGAGTIDYYTSSSFTVLSTGTPGPESVFHSFNGTGENANVFYGPLPWPFSPSMTAINNSFTQLFELTPGGLPPVSDLRKKDLANRHGLPPLKAPA